MTRLATKTPIKSLFSCFYYKKVAISLVFILISVYKA